MERLVVLLRAVNVGKRQMAMAALRGLVTELGYAEPQTYVASGNLIIGAPDRAQVERDLPLALAARFGFPVEIIVRTSKQLQDTLAFDPFPDAARTTPNLVFVLFSQNPQPANAAALLGERALPSEHLAQDEHALWLHCADGMARSKLSPALIDKTCGSPTTARNVRTLAKLIELAQ